MHIRDDDERRRGQSRKHTTVKKQDRGSSVPLHHTGDGAYEE